MPIAQFDHQAAVDAPRHRLWEALQHPETYEGIGPVDRVWDAVHREEILTGYRWSADVGLRRIEGSATTKEAIAPERMVLELDAGEVTGVLTLDLAEQSATTALTVGLTMEANGVLSTLFFGAIRDAIARGLPAQVDALAAKLAAAG